MAEAKKRIAEEAERRTGSLDLSGLGLDELPDELFELTHLRELDIGTSKPWDLDKANHIDARRNDLARLRHLTFLSVMGSDLTSLDFLKELRELKSVYCSFSEITDISPLACLIHIQTIHCSDTRVKDLSPLVGLVNLQEINCSSTAVTDLSPLAGLIDLDELNCWNTAVMDLSPLAGLADLRKLECAATGVTDLSPLEGLVNLDELNCWHTGVRDLSPLKGIAALQIFDCSRTDVTDLSPLKGLVALQTLNCRRTGVTDLSPLKGLTALQKLDCSVTAVTDLSSLDGLAALKSLDCSDTAVTDLSPLKDLAALRELHFSNCALRSFPTKILNLPVLEKLVLLNTTVPGLPPSGVLSSTYDDNCLDRVRAHFADLAAGAESLLRVKLLLIGNGGAGKTQIARRLSGRKFDENWDSTHGIEVGRATLAEEPEVQLRVWDFGGQDIYHGAHALFLSAPAIVAVVWDKKTEAEEIQTCGELEHRIQPLPYWVKVAQHQGHAHSPHLVIQNKCDRAEDEVRRFPIPDGLLDPSPYAATLHVSAKTGRGFAALTEKLTDAAVWLRAPERMGLPTVGAGRLRAQRRLEAMREADRELPPDQRRHRLLNLEEFTTICREEGGVSSPEHLLTWLDAEGAVIYRPALLPDRIVLDQNWALTAIYSVFERAGGTYKAILARGGRFNQNDLAYQIWRNHSQADQKLFIVLMRSCGICFLHRRFDDDAFNEYIAPDLLPDRAGVAGRLAGLWDEDAPTEQAALRHPLLHSGLIRSIMAELGERARSDAIYWRGGVWGFEEESGSRLMIEAIETGPWCGEIRVRTQRGRAAELLDQLVTLVERTQNRLGLRPGAVERVSRAPVREEPRDLTFTQEKPKAKEWYVSYAWNDDKTPEGKTREQVVDDLCAAADRRGIIISRDKNILGMWDSISAFMRRIGGGDRVFVVMSEKYLSSPNCMFELSEVWRTSLRDETFLNRVRLFTLPDAKIWTAEDRADWAIHWKTRFDGLDSRVREHGSTILGARDHAHLRQMQLFYTNVAEILALLADRIQPRAFDELVRYGFDDPA